MTPAILLHICCLTDGAFAHNVRFSSTPLQEIFDINASVESTEKSFIVVAMLSVQQNIESINITIMLTIIRLTISIRVAQLVTDDLSVIGVPSRTTHLTPDTIYTYFNQSFIVDTPSVQSNSSISAGTIIWNYKNIIVRVN